jgi:XRE family aerobic/anaerobic benzoate catabolism transcriptional regulator
MEGLLGEMGERIRWARLSQGLTLREVAGRSGSSLRFVSDLEKGRSNVSMRRLMAVAVALNMELSELLLDPAFTLPESVERVARKMVHLDLQSFRRIESSIDQALRVDDQPSGFVALLGLRGAGKSTVGPRLAEALGMEFFELDQMIEHASGLSLAEIFSIHGHDYYRRLEREVLGDFLARHHRGVIATGGSIVTHLESFTLLRERTHTVWLRALAKDHWNRVLAQGDDRPMRRNPRAFDQLEELLRAREPLYALAHDVVDTSNQEVSVVVQELVDLVLADRA